MRRILVLLATACAVLLGLVLLLARRQLPVSKTPFAQAREATQIVLKEGDREILLKKEDQKWKVAPSASSPALYPVDEPKIKAFTDSLSAVEVEDVIGDRADRAAEFEVDTAKGIRVLLSNAVKTSLGDGIFGKQAPDFTHLYFRYPDRPLVYLARGLIRGDLQVSLNAWRSHDVVPYAEAEMQSITFEKLGSKIQLNRSSETWKVNGKPANAQKVYGLVGTLAHLQADTFPEAFGGDISGPVLTITIRAATGQVILRIGSIGSKDPMHLAVTDAIPSPGGIFQISDEKVKTLQPKLSDLMSH